MPDFTVKIKCGISCSHIIQLEYYYWKPVVHLHYFFPFVIMTVPYETLRLQFMYDAQKIHTGAGVCSTCGKWSIMKHQSLEFFKSISNIQF